MERIEALKNEIKVSSVKLFNIAEKSLIDNKGLENVVILKRMFRCDTLKNDPAQLKNHLSEYGNRVLDDIWLTKWCPQNIRIAQQALDCNGELRCARFGLPTSKGYDGVHMRGKMSVQHYTGSVLNALSEVLPNLVSTLVTLPGAHTYANIVRNNIPFKQNKQVHRNKFRPQTHELGQAQPQPGNNVHAPHPHYQQKTGFMNSPATGVNSIPLGHDHKYYNVKTQNRFSPVSEN